ILFLVKSGVIKTKSSSEEINVLNTEFLPMGRGGTLVLKQFQFCVNVDKSLNCLNEINSFERGENVYIRFVVESSIYNGEVLIVRNYRMKNPEGEVILEVDETNNYNFAAKSNRETEKITVADYIPTMDNSPEGEYTLDLIVENPLLNKKVTTSNQFLLKPDFLPEAFE
ncbi:MAG TPA: hypothetical protein VJG49_03040, partial [Candidatus Nanoarchaeia archaeon]|nr:hypothetical protein [Candidatus Nanoarchaeia archaeon]